MFVTADKLCYTGKQRVIPCESCKRQVKIQVHTATHLYLWKWGCMMRNYINESSENYLETILLLSRRLPVVRAVDIANELNFKKPSVSIAMKNLREKDQITVSEQGFIYLTKKGKEIAEMIYERHLLISSWLEKLGVPADTAVQDACKIEHVISRESFEAVKNYVNSISS